MESFLVSFSTVAIAEMGDRTQLLALVLAARFRRPWPVLAGVLVASLVSMAVAGYVGAHLGAYLTPARVDAIVGVSMIGMGLWTLKPDSLEGAGAQPRQANAFVATCIAFFIAELGDKTEIATVALGAAYPSLLGVVSGTTLGMLAANAPVIFLGSAFSSRLPLKAIHITATVLFIALGVLFLWRAYRAM